MQTEVESTVSVASSDHIASAARRASGDPGGVVLVDKPLGITSHDVVDAVRRILRMRAVGHTGTLDPTASGLMIMLVGRATKIAPIISGMTKCYRAVIRLGLVSDTGDTEGHLSPSGDPAAVNPERLNSVLRTFIGEVSLKVPAFAAVRTDGRRRYELARAGQDVPALERTATIHSADLLAFESSQVTVRVSCSAGTYIRSYAEAVGEALGCGAYLTGLRREQIGKWHVNEAATISKLEAQVRDKSPGAILLPMEQFLDFARVVLHNRFSQAVAVGQSITGDMIAGTDGSFTDGDTVVLSDESGMALALVTALVNSDDLSGHCPSGALFNYRRVLI